MAGNIALGIIGIVILCIVGYLWLNWDMANNPEHWR